MGCETVMPEAFREVMRRLASGICLITSEHEGAWVGMAATAVMSVSASPPSLAVCVNRSASLHPAIIASGRFCVNVLNGRHEALVPIFSGREKGAARFKAGEWIEEFGLPQLADAQAALVCTQVGQLEHGTHTIFVGSIEQASFNTMTDPLVWFDGRVVRPEARDGWNG